MANSSVYLGENWNSKDALEKFRIITKVEALALVSLKLDPSKYLFGVVSRING